MRCTNNPFSDGIGVGHSTNIQIIDCEIDTYDDCIIINSGSSGVTARNIMCKGGTHGLSVGGKTSGVMDIKDITFASSTIINGMASVRIKMAVEMSGTISGITYKDIKIEDAQGSSISKCQSARCETQTGTDIL